jgi:hypothetical protein
MMGKDGSTEHPASVAAEASQSGQPQSSVRPERRDKPKTASRGRVYLACSNNELERKATMEPRRPSHEHQGPPGMLDRSLQAQLGRQLRAIFADIAEEPVPERFIKLLEALEDKEKPR